MNKSVIIGSIAAIIIIGGGAALVTTHKSSSPKPSTATSTKFVDTDHDGDNDAAQGASDMGSSSSTTPSATNTVKISNFAFGPAAITVSKGTTVTWTNTDSVAHTVTETDGQTGPSSASLATNKSYSFTYNTAGTFKYHCSIHPDMTGTVTVTD